MRRSLSVPEWHRMAQEGNTLPVRIQLNGNSMYPLIRYRRDYVTVMPLDSEPQTGDIVLFCEPNTERYVMHRVWDRKDGEILTWGDNCPQPDGWMPAGAVWGKTVQIERGRRRIQPNPRKGMLWAKFWHRAGRVYRFYRRCKDGIARRIRKWKV